MVLLSLLLAANAAAAVTPAIRINQLGFPAEAPKTAAVVGASSEDFCLLSAAGDTVFRGKLGAEALWEPSQERARLADFGAFKTPGTFTLAVPGLGVSSPFTIGGTTLLDLTRGSLRAYYYQRASTALEATHAGKWARAAGHPDIRVSVHSSAATASRPAESFIQSPRGWYDAGDYGKYVVNSGISTYTLLALYRHYPALFDTLGLNIPESGGGLPDILDEVLWNLRWMLTMQDQDGGVYHKLTTANFSGMVMPANDTQKRYVVQKSVTASLNLAAVAAYASRVFRKHESKAPGFADSALAAARKAWDWSRANPTALYRQNDMNRAHSPQITTGEYGDGNAQDEFQWAGVELYLATKVDSFYTAAYPTSAALPATLNVPAWNSVRTLAFYSMSDEAGPDYPLIDAAAVRQRLRDAATVLAATVGQSAFRVPMTNRDFIWGSNSVSGNMGMLLVQAYRATGDAAYLKPAMDALDYLLGRNGPSLSFVTGFGARSPQHPHHRPSEADGLPDPVPGFLVGGPNTGKQDNCVYPSVLPALSYSDTECSYASNEVTINWNAPLAYLGGALHALYTGLAGPQGIGPGRPGRLGAATLRWAAGAGPELSLPAGLKGKVEFFDGQGRLWAPSRISDNARTGDRPGLLFFRLVLEGPQGRLATRTGSWPTLSALRVPL